MYVCNAVMFAMASGRLRLWQVVVGGAAFFLGMSLIISRVRSPAARQSLARTLRGLRWACVAFAIPSAILAAAAWYDMLDSHAAARAAARGMRVDGTSLALFAITIPIATLVCLGIALGWRWLESRVRRAPG